MLKRGMVCFQQALNLWFCHVASHLDRSAFETVPPCLRSAKLRQLTLFRSANLAWG